MECYAGVSINKIAVTRVPEVWYHGSPRRFDNFRTEVRHTFGDGPTETALFFTPDLDFAKLHARGPEGTIYKVSLRYRKIFDGRKQIVSDQYLRYWRRSPEHCGV